MGRPEAIELGWAFICLVVLFFNLDTYLKTFSIKGEGKERGYSDRVVVSQQDSLFTSVRFSGKAQIHSTSSQCMRLLGLLNSLKFHTLDSWYSFKTFMPGYPSPLPSGSQVQGLRKQVSHNEPVAQSRLYFTPLLAIIPNPRRRYWCQDRFKTVTRKGTRWQSHRKLSNAEQVGSIRACEVP